MVKILNTAAFIILAFILASIVPQHAVHADAPQTISNAALQKLAPEFVAELISKRTSFRSARTLSLARPFMAETRRLITHGDAYDCVIRTIAEPNPALLEKANSVIPNFVTARLTLDEMLSFAADANIVKIYPGDILYPHNDVAAGLTGADLAHSGAVNSTVYDGTGVIMLIFDTGIDYKHLDFRDPVDTTQSRILYLWDQLLTKTGAEVTPSGRDLTNFSMLNYGVEYSRANLNNELDGTPAGLVRSFDTFGHGTHVAGSAAGNGASLPSKKYAGIAPKADIVVVKGGISNFTSVNIINGLTYARQISVSEGKPVVVNMSLGGHQHAHDGTYDLDIAVDNFTSSGSGRVAVISAGNEGSSSMHTSGTVAANASVSIDITIPTYTPRSGGSNDYVLFEAWWEDDADYSVKVTNPFFTEYNGADGFVGVNAFTSQGSVYIDNAVSANHTNGDQRTSVQIYDGFSSSPPLSGTWTITLTNNSPVSKNFHGWMFGNTLKAVIAGSNSEYTVGSPGTASSAITVASYASRMNWHADNNGNHSFGAAASGDDISYFSSVGPRRDNVQKPDIAAPGQMIVSTRSGNSGVADSFKVNAVYRVNTGTSMAAPLTAGAAALLLDHNPLLTAAQVKSLLTSNAFTDALTGAPFPNTRWGHGKLDVFNAVEHAVNASSPRRADIFAYDGWSALSSAAVAPLEKIAVKFSPIAGGSVSGALFHTHAVVNISSPVTLEIWSDNAGLPGVKLGATVSYPFQSVSANTWNYVNMQASGAALIGGASYYLVLSYASGTSPRDVADAGTVSGRSFSNNGASWGAFAGNYKLRPVVVTSEALLPVELTAFTAATRLSNAVLSWATASEVNNFGFEVERRASAQAPAPVRPSAGTENAWTKTGFVEGAGSSNAPNTYSFTDRNLPPGTYTYRLKQIDRDGAFEYSQQVEVTVGGAPKAFALEQNFPNPFNPSTVIGFQIPAAGLVSLKVYDVVGREVATLVNEVQEAGYHSAQFDASRLSSGIYFARLTAGGKSQMKKLLLMK